MVNGLVLMYSFSTLTEHSKHFIQHQTFTQIYTPVDALESNSGLVSLIKPRTFQIADVLLYLMSYSHPTYPEMLRAKGGVLDSNPGHSSLRMPYGK